MVVKIVEKCPVCSSIMYRSDNGGFRCSSCGMNVTVTDAERRNILEERTFDHIPQRNIRQKKYRPSREFEDGNNFLQDVKEKSTEFMNEFADNISQQRVSQQIFNNNRFQRNKSSYGNRALESLIGIGITIVLIIFFIYMTIAVSI